MPIKELLEEYNLYQKYNINVPEYLNDFEKPTIHMYCDKCESEQTFVMKNNYFMGIRGNEYPSAGELLYLDYLCAGCNDFHRGFLIKVSDNLDYIIKVGQYPEKDISIDKNIEKAIKKHKILFRKGLICEAQGYGIGAYAYYRRIVELIIDELLDDIYELIDENGKDEYKKALDSTKTTQQTSDKIKLVKELLPSSLRPGGKNPLGILYKNLSEGIHSKSDAECINIAKEIKAILVYLVKQVILSKQEKKEFTECMDKLLSSK